MRENVASGFIWGAPATRVSAIATSRSRTLFGSHLRSRRVQKRRLFRRVAETSTRVARAPRTEASAAVDHAENLGSFSAGARIQTVIAHAIRQKSFTSAPVRIG